MTRQKKGKRKKEGRKEIKKDSRGSPTTAAAATVCAHLFLLHESCLLPWESQVLGGDDAHWWVAVKHRKVVPLPCDKAYSLVSDPLLLYTRMIFKDMRNCTAANKLAASAGKVHGGLTVKCDTHKGLQFTLLVFIFMPIILKCKYKSLLLDRTRQKKPPRKVLIPIQGTNVEERCGKADRWSPSNETSIVRNCDSILAIGYILISPIFFLDKPSRKIVQRSYFYSLPLCKEGWERWSPISLHGRCCILILHPVQKNEQLHTLKVQFWNF